ncbi:hypothetical protein SAMN02910353_01351 [Ruminococcus sp. YRD2003]|uniref:hypothetical protein n=1 Tax=Ruminococcus sp. YRD2003 TaxID=1452313 RepID=UPI0008C69A7C|nr:hypothetical protein SAMN02910353_01351 [Ruminococcus flavefaciens]
MDEIESREEKVKKPLKILLIVFGCLFGVGAVILVLLCLIWRNTFQGYQVDSVNGNTTTCYRAVTNHITDYYAKQGKEVPTDKEYIVKATWGRDGLVTEPCELLPESGENQYFSSTVRDTHYLLIKYKAGGGYEAWLAEKPLTDDMLRPYERGEQQEMFGVLKGTKDVIGYICSDKPTEYYH